MPRAASAGVLLLLVLTGCAEETGSEGSLTMRGYGVGIPWFVLVGVALVTLLVHRLVTRRRPPRR